MKRWLSFLLIISILVGMLSCLSGCSKKGNEIISRAEWIELLGSEFGLDEFVSKENSFSDVKETDEIYNYVQSCLEWGVLDASEGSKFNPTENATVDFALSTALSAADVNLGDVSEEEYARDKGIIGKAYLDYKGNLTRAKAEDVVDWAKDLYLNQEKEPVENVVLNESVENLKETTQVLNASGDTFTLSGAGVQDVAEGDIIILPASAEYPDGYARKVVSLSQGNGAITIETVDPTVEELCADLEVSTVVVPEKEDIVLGDGVSWSDGVVPTNVSGDEFQIQNLLPDSQDKLVLGDTSKGLDFSVNVNFTKGKISLADNWKGLLGATLENDGKIKLSKDFDSLFGVGEKVTVGGEYPFSVWSTVPNDAGKLFEKSCTIPDKTLFGSDPYDNTAAIEAYKAGNMSLDELKKELNLTADQKEKEVASMTNKFAGSYEITGALSIKNLYVEPEVKAKKVFGVPVGIEKLGVEVNYDVSSSLSIKGKLTEELTVCTCPVPVGGTGITVEVKLILFADFNGQLTVRAEISNNTKMEIENGKTKKTSNNSSSVSADFSATLDVGPGLKVDVLLYGIRMIDTKLTCAVRLKTNMGVSYGTTYSTTDEEITINRKTKCYLTGKGYVPIVKLSVGYDGKSLASKLKLSFSWEIVGEKTAYQFDMFNFDYTIWEETLTMKLRDEDDKEDEDENQKNLGDYLKIDDYYINMDDGETAKISISNLPEGYTEGDLIWSTEDAGIATVSGGMVVANDYGSTTISVQTSDGVYSCYCAVHVSSSPVDFTPLEEIDYDI